jgi:hypothetical protein
MRAVACIGAVLFACVAMANAADEDALQDLWKQHMTAPDDHDALIKACGEFAGAHANDPLLPIVRGLEEWHRMKAGQKEEWEKMLTADLALPAGAVNDGARRLALAWLTRVDREQVAAALQEYYRKQVAYPKSLELVAAAKPPMNDRFGKPWVYRLTGFAKLPGFTDQKYSLQSAVLGEMSELKAAQQLPYASRIKAAPVQVVAGAGNAPAVKFNFGTAAGVVNVGQSAGELFLAYSGTQIIVVCDLAHWKVFPHPN